MSLSKYQHCFFFIFNISNVWTHRVNDRLTFIWTKTTIKWWNLRFLWYYYCYYYYYYHHHHHHHHCYHYHYRRRNEQLLPKRDYISVRCLWGVVRSRVRRGARATWSIEQTGRDHLRTEWKRHCWDLEKTRSLCKKGKPHITISDEASSLVVYTYIDQKLVNSLNGLLNCEIGGLDYVVMTTEHSTRVYWINMLQLCHNALVGSVWSMFR